MTWPLWSKAPCDFTTVVPIAHQPIHSPPAAEPEPEFVHITDDELAAVFPRDGMINGTPVSMFDIANSVSRETGFSVSELCGLKRHRNVVRARQLCMRKGREAGMTLGQIGEFLNRDHTTVLHGLKAMEKILGPLNQSAETKPEKHNFTLSGIKFSSAKQACKLLGIDPQKLVHRVNHGGYAISTINKKTGSAREKIIKRMMDGKWRLLEEIHLEVPKASEARISELVRRLTEEGVLEKERVQASTTWEIMWRMKSEWLT